MNALPHFARLRHAILHAPPKAVGFPLQSLHERARLRGESHLQHILSQIKEEADRAHATPIPALPLSLFRLFEETGDRAQFEGVYFDRRRRLAALTLSALLPDPDKEAQGTEPLSNLLWEICNEYTWALPAHLPVGMDAVRANRLSPEQIVDLFAAETAAALAEVLSLLGNRLDPWIVLRVRQEVERRIFQPLFENPVRFGWETEAMNWAAVCAGSAGIAALILEDDRERLAHMIDRVLPALEVFLSGFPNDGGTPEGIVYWEYGFGFYLYFAEALREFTGGAVDLLDDDHVRRIAAFPNAVALGDNHFVNFSDANATVYLHAGLCSRLAERTGAAMPPLPRVDFNIDHIFRWAHISRDIAWSRSAAETSVDNGTFYFPDLAWVIDRRIVQGQTIAFAAKGGHNDEPHNHNDLGHFILHVGGESLLADVGAGRYSRQYFGAERYDSIHNGAQGHSVPVINGLLQQAGREYVAVPAQYKTGDDSLEFELDLTRAYSLPALFWLTRSFNWRFDTETEAGTLVLGDYWNAAEAVAVDECLVSLREPELFSEGTDECVVWRGVRGTVVLRYPAADFAPEVATTPSTDHFGKPIVVYTLTLRALHPRTQGHVALVFNCQQN